MSTNLWDYIIDKTPKVVSFMADSLTVILGLVAVWGLLFHKKEISFFLRTLINTQFNERVKRIKETLGKLESLNYVNKLDRPEIYALLGQVAGQVRPLCRSNNGLTKICEQISTVLDTRKLNEATKRQITYELHGALDDAALEGTLQSVEIKK